MTVKELRNTVRCGEDSCNQFKLDMRSPDALASEIVAFLNSKGGTIFVGVSDVGELVGLSAEDVRRINQLVSNVASQSVRDPVSLPNHLTVEKILAGNSNIRNPVLASFVAKGILPYHGLGSGVMRVMELCPNTKFVDDKEGVQFKAIVPRVPTVSTAMMDEGMGAVATEMPTEEVGLLKSSQKSSQKIIEIISQRPEVTTVVSGVSR